MRTPSRSTRTIPAVTGLAVLLLAACSGTRAEAVALEVEVRARALMPGEPLRVVVVSAEPLATVEGSFLGHTVAMVATDGDDGKRFWSGWAIVALDEKPQAAMVEVHGTTTDGRVGGDDRRISAVGDGAPHHDGAGTGNSTSDGANSFASASTQDSPMVLSQRLWPE